MLALTIGRISVSCNRRAFRWMVVLQALCLANSCKRSDDDRGKQPAGRMSATSGIVEYASDSHKATLAADASSEMSSSAARLQELRERLAKEQAGACSLQLLGQERRDVAEFKRQCSKCRASKWHADCDYCKDAPCYVAGTDGAFTVFKSCGSAWRALPKGRIFPKELPQCQ